MEAFSFKLPAAAIAQLQHQADRLGCNRGALGRALLMRSLDQLEQNDAQGVA
jgi:hypothetical protein